MNGAQDAQTASGHTVGNAIEAYTLAQDTQMKRQKLEQEKQQNELNKANWLNSQIVNIGRQPEGAARDLMLKSFSNQLPSVVPGANPDITELFKRDPEMLRKATEAAQHYMQNQSFDPTALNAFFSMSTPEAIDAMNKNAENIAKIKAQQMGAQQVKAQNQQDAQVTGVLSKWDAHPQLQKLVGLGNKLDNDLTLLSTHDPKHPVTYQAVHEVIQNIATVLGNGTVSDSRVNSISPETGGELANRIATFAADDPNRPASPEIIRFAKSMTERLNNNITQQVSSTSRQIGSARTNAALFHNPIIAQAAQEKMQYFDKGQWRMAAQGAPAEQAQAPAAGAPTEGATQNYNGATYKVIGGHWVKQGAQQAGGMGGQ